MLVGGLTAGEAREIVAARFSRPLRLVGGSGARISVFPAELGAVAHIAAAVRLAARIRRPGFAVPLTVEVPRARVDRFVTSLGTRFYRESVDATLRLRDSKPFATRDVPGRRLRTVVTARAISLALKTQQRSPLELSFDKTAAPVTSDALGRAIVIKRGSNELYLYRVGTKPKLIRMFRVATGRSQYPTPLGKFEIVNMQLHPWWYPPAGSEWAKDAKPIPPGPGNPLGTRWMGLSAPNVGIHGTSSPSSIGYSASHGCVRMLIPEAEWLYSQVDLGTPVFVVAA
ncbi:MAG: hypothetical protein EXQ81_05315 [Thermoleophilia bacterium]|nr:hypothetical protein [Thermoleophilia bacterium]